MKQMIVMRTDLNMRKGKMCAQAAHASMGAVLPYLRHPVKHIDSDVHKVEEWLANSFTKICVRVATEVELEAVVNSARAAGLITCVITDNGKTEFGGVPTVTCAAIGPDTDEALNPVTGELKLL